MTVGLAYGWNWFTARPSIVLRSGNDAYPYLILRVEIYLSLKILSFLFLALSWWSPKAATVKESSIRNLVITPQQQQPPYLI